jgi:DNA-binding NarL/FixJ family response regulator
LPCVRRTCYEPLVSSQLDTQGIAEGLSNKAIAARLFVTERTVESHVTQILLQLGIDERPDSHRRVLAVLAFLRS